MFDKLSHFNTMNSYAQIIDIGETLFLLPEQRNSHPNYKKTAPSAPELSYDFVAFPGFQLETENNFKCCCEYCSSPPTSDDWVVVDDDEFVVVSTPGYLHEPFDQTLACVSFDRAYAIVMEYLTVHQGSRMGDRGFCYKATQELTVLVMSSGNVRYALEQRDNIKQRMADML